METNNVFMEGTIGKEMHEITGSQTLWKKLCLVCDFLSFFFFIIFVLEMESLQCTASSLGIPEQNNF